MATTSIGNLSTTDNDFVLAKASAQLKIEVMERNLPLRLLQEYNVLNFEEKLQNDAGDTVNIYGMSRLDTKGNRGDHDRYSNAVAADYNQRSLKIDLLSTSLRYKVKGTMTQQRAPFDMRQGRQAIATNWIKEMTLLSIMNQAGGNTATSITAPSCASTAFSGGDLTKVTGFNPALAPSSIYKDYGSRAAGSISDDQSVTSSNVLKLQDFMDAREVITSVSAGVPAWNLCQGAEINGMPVQALVFVGTSGMNQLKNDAVTVGQGINFAQLQYAMLAGGKKFEVGAGLYFMENMLFVELPDYLMPRGVHTGTSAEVANTRRAIITGMGAVNHALGAGYTMNGGTAENGGILGGYRVKLDNQYKKNNDEEYLSVESICGFQKDQTTGQGANASTAYDTSTYVITHHTAN